MDAFKGKYERTSAEQYEEFLKVYILVSSWLPPSFKIGSWRELPPEKGRHCVHAGDGGDRGGRSLDHQDLHNPQDYGA